MSSVPELLLLDAAAALTRQLKVRPQTDLAVVFANWCSTTPEDTPELQLVLSTASARTGAQQDFQTIAALGFALHGGFADSASRSALKQGIDRLIGRQPFVDGVPMPFCSDAIGLLGVALGAKVIAEPGLSERVTAWLHGFLRTIYDMEGTEDWQRCVFYAADYSLGGTIGLSRVSSEQAADVRAVLSTMGIIQPSQHPEQDAIAVYNLLARTSIHSLSYERAAIRYAALNLLTRAAPIAVPGRMTVESLVKLLDRVSAGLRKWTWEKKPRTANAALCKWSVNNEYHVQNLLWVLLAPIFPDLDDEQYLAKIGPKNPRADLYIPSMQLVVEVKFIRPTDSFQKVIDEISSDASLYGASGNACRDIVVFIWDDSGRSHEHDYLKHGLRKLPGITDVIVVSRPNDWKLVAEGC